MLQFFWQPTARLITLSRTESKLSCSWTWNVLFKNLTFYKWFLKTIQQWLHFYKGKFCSSARSLYNQQHVQKVTILRREWLTSFHCCFLRKWQQNYYFSFELKRLYQQDCFETCVGKIVMQKVPPSSRLDSLWYRGRPIITLLVQHYKQFQGTLGQVRVMSYPFHNW